MLISTSPHRLCQFPLDAEIDPSPPGGHKAIISGIAHNSTSPQSVFKLSKSSGGSVSSPVPDHVGSSPGIALGLVWLGISTGGRDGIVLVQLGVH